MEGTGTAVAGVTRSQIDKWFAYHVPDGQQLRKLQGLSDAGKELALAILNNTPPGPDQSAAIRLVRDALFTANAAITSTDS